jgi:hypothetical protein
MADVNITFGRALQGVAQVPSAIPTASELLSSSGTSEESVNAASQGDICTITTDGPIWVAFGGAPTASAGDDHLILAGTTRYFGNLGVGTKVAVVDG